MISAKGGPAFCVAAYNRAMKIRTIVLCLAVGCGGGSKKTEEPKPATTEQAVTQQEAPPAPPPAEKKEPAEPPPPPAPKLVLGEAKIVMKAPKEKMSAEFVIAADGAVSVTTTSGAKKTKKTTTGKLTAEGELKDDKDETIAKIADDGTVSVRIVMEEKKDGKVVKSESKMEDVGKLGDDGVFTNAKDGKTMSIDDKGKLAGFPADFTVTAKPEQKKAVMLVVVGMFGAAKMTSETSAASAPAKK